jgi:hypothetical protein
LKVDSRGSIDPGRQHRTATISDQRTGTYQALKYFFRKDIIMIDK